MVTRLNVCIARQDHIEKSCLDREQIPQCPLKNNAGKSISFHVSDIMFVVYLFDFI